MSRSKSSARWLQRRRKDCYAEKARQAGRRSRAAVKLQQMDERYGLLRAGMNVLDLGAAPGGWSQYAVSRIGNGKLVAVDVLDMKPIPGVCFLQGDVADRQFVDRAIDFFQNAPIDFVMSDMAPNITGVRSVDMPKVFALAQTAREIACQALHRQGIFLVKVFQGEGFEQYLSQIKELFITVKTCKPVSSRQESREVYLLAGHVRSENV